MVTISGSDGDTGSHDGGILFLFARNGKCENLIRQTVLPIVAREALGPVPGGLQVRRARVHLFASVLECAHVEAWRSYSVGFRIRQGFHSLLFPCLLSLVNIAIWGPAARHTAAGRRAETGVNLLPAAPPTLGFKKGRTIHAKWPKACAHASSLQVAHTTRRICFSLRQARPLTLQQASGLGRALRCRTWVHPTTRDGYSRRRPEEGRRYRSCDRRAKIPAGATVWLMLNPAVAFRHWRKRNEKRNRNDHRRETTPVQGARLGGGGGGGGCGGWEEERKGKGKEQTVWRGPEIRAGPERFGSARTRHGAFPNGNYDGPQEKLPRAPC